MDEHCIQNGLQLVFRRCEYADHVSFPHERQRRILPRQLTDAPGTMLMRTRSVLTKDDIKVSQIKIEVDGLSSLRRLPASD